MTAPKFQRRQYNVIADALLQNRFGIDPQNLEAMKVLNDQISYLVKEFRIDNPAFEPAFFRQRAGFDYALDNQIVRARYEAQAKERADRDALAQRQTAALARRAARAANPVPGLTSSVLAGAVAELARSRRTNAGIRAMRSRASEFGTTAEMMLAGIAMDPAARAGLDTRLDEYWAKYRAVYYYGRPVSEVIIGGGLHAAVYAAGRAARGYPRPLVIEQSDRPGGAFAVSRAPSFYLNSRNRPGLPGLPNQGQALNVIPGAPVQMAALSGLQFQTNADMAYVIRATLAEFADVLTGVRVTGISMSREDYGDYSTVTLDNGKSITCLRVIDARGLGSPDAAGASNGSTIITFPEFMAKMDTAYPLRGMRRVAVIGGGDSGKCTVESLMGTGPDGSRSVTALDYVEKVDLYAPGLPDTCDEWRKTQRGRYQDIGSFLPQAAQQATVDRFGNRNPDYRPSRPSRVNVYKFRGTCTPSVGNVIVGNNAYDMAVLATGSTLPEIDGAPLGRRTPGFRISGDSEFLGRKADSYEYYRVGPAADLPFSELENRTGISAIPANIVAMFRLNNRTSAMAYNLPDLTR